MKNKICLITGATSGLGYEISLALAKMGASVILIGRDANKTANAAKQIKEQANNTEIYYYVADLSLQSALLRLSIEIHREFSVIDVLINNVGGAFPQFQLTTEGLERTFALNQMSYFVLTHLLLDLVEASDYARIINVSSHDHFSGKFSIADIVKNNRYRASKAYANAKLAGLLFSYELAEKLSNTQITVNALCPGAVKTDIVDKNFGWHIRLLWNIFMFLVGRTPQEAIDTYLYLATDDDVRGVSGKCFYKKEEITTSNDSYNLIMRQKLWRVCGAITIVPIREIVKKPLAKTQ